MPSAPRSDTLRVQVSDDRLRAELVIPHQVHVGGLSAGALQPIVEDAHVVWTEQVQAAIAAILAEPRTPGKAVYGVIARGKPPRHGVDGSLEWTIDADRSADLQQIESYYDRSAFITVHPGDVLGRLVPPQPGEVGRDVTGKDIPALIGKPYPLRLDETIVARDDGTLIAVTAGLLVRSDRAATIQQVLSIPEGVDFSTGNIDFQGSILVQRGVRDRFVVRASQNIQINGLVEAATIACGGDLHLKGGFAGREHGNAVVGGHMHARYLDGVTAEVRGDLHVTREIINCSLLVHGNLLAPGGSIIGGRVVVAGRLHAANLGSAGAVRTHLVLGTVPRLDPMYDDLRSLRDDCSRRILTLEKAIRAIEELPESERLADEYQRRLNEMRNELDAITPQHDRTEVARAALEKRLDELRVVEVHLVRRLNEGVVIECRQRRYLVRSVLDGPVHLGVDPDGVLIYEARGGRSGPISEVAEFLVHDAQAA